MLCWHPNKVLHLLAECDQTPKDDGIKLFAYLLGDNKLPLVVP